MGLQFRFDLIERLPNTRRSHLLIAHAARHGLQGEAAERVMQAYFEEGCDIGDVEELVRLGVEIGLSDAKRDPRWSCGRARTGWLPPNGTPPRSASPGVPTFIFDRQYTLSGAQEVDTFTRCLRSGRGARRGARSGAVTPAELTGSARSHIVDLADPPCALHAHVVAPFSNLRRAAAADGFDLVPVSSFRDFARQLAIWNGKFSGATPLYDASGRALDARAAAQPPSASRRFCNGRRFPGASRHHWGTDLDLIDGNAAASGYRVQLTAAEFAPRAVCAARRVAGNQRSALRLFPAVSRSSVGCAARTLAFQLRAGCRAARAAN